MTNSRRSFLRNLGMGMAGLAFNRSSFSAGGKAGPKRPPNVVLFLIDDQGYADLGCYGAKGFSTPSIDRLSAEGVRFTQFCVSQAVCSASRASLLTGCYSERVNIAGALNPWAQNGLNTEEETIAELLKARGYSTGIIGKWHLGHLPEFLPGQQGFDEYFGLPYSNDMWPVGFDGKPASEGWKAFYPPLPLLEGSTRVAEIRNLEDQATLTGRYTKKAVEFIERHRSRPFFLYLAHSMVHVPLGVSERFRGKSRLGPYGDAMMEIDWSVGEVLEALKRYDLENDTLVIYTSDNGPWLTMGDHGGSAGPLREGKGTAFEGGVRVPCLMRWPGVIHPGTVCSSLAATIDILPTVCAATEAPLPRRKIDGVNILPLLRGEPGAAPRNEYYYYYDAELRGVRRGKWKLMFPHTSQSTEGMAPGANGFPGKSVLTKVGLELYDLDADPGERVNVASRHPEIVSDLQELGERARQELGDRLTGRKGSGVRPAGRRSVHRPVTDHLAIGAPLKFAYPHDKKYDGGGEGALVDGKRGSLDLADLPWVGFEGDDLDVVVDLRMTRTVERVTCGFLQSQHSWIFYPREFRVAASDDGNEFRAVWSSGEDPVRPDPIPAIRDIVAEFDPVSTRFVRIVAKSIGSCPAWHPGAGGKAWIFADEIEVR